MIDDTNILDLQKIHIEDQQTTHIISSIALITPYNRKTIVKFVLTPFQI